MRKKQWAFHRVPVAGNQRMTRRHRMSKRGITGILVVVALLYGTPTTSAWGKDTYRSKQDRGYNTAYTGDRLNRLAFPLGGLGAGMICLEGTGAISHVSVRNEMEFFNEPCMFAALCIKNKKYATAKILEGQVPRWKIFGNSGTGNGATGASYGFPRFLNASFLARFPFGTITLQDGDVPLGVNITGWTAFVPTEPDLSSLPATALEYEFTNNTSETIETVFSYNAKNFMDAGSGDRILPYKNGFILFQPESSDTLEREGAFAIFTDNADTVVDHCWFKGGWWDSLTITWDTIAHAQMIDNPPVEGSAPGASLFVPLSIKPGGKQTVRLMMAWYVPHTKLRYGRDAAEKGPAFGYGPSQGSATNQQTVSGFKGKGLVNTFNPSGDGLTGTLTSPPVELNRNYIHFLIGGGNEAGKTCINLSVDGRKVRTATGNKKETLSWHTWDIGEFKGKKGTLSIVDKSTLAWGHINVDHIVLSDTRNPAAATGDDTTVLHDFEGADFGSWKTTGPPAPRTYCPNGQCTIPEFFEPWYISRFKNVQETADYFRSHYGELRRKTALFSNTFYNTTLPPEVVEAVAANLTILLSPTVLRQSDGRLWCWEGCCDSHGCCAGSCTHVWNYAQAICHLFPSLERTLRHTEFFESQNAEGHQTFRSALPIRPVAHTFHAASDGQLGGIMKIYREWRISGDTSWLKAIWPNVKQSLNYCIETWDPRHKGVLEEPHHNTYDIEYWGPDGHCSSFYLGALQAAVKMGEALSDDVSLYRTLLKKGKQFLENELFNGEYFYQKIQTEGLNAEFHPIQSSGNGKGYQEIVNALNKQGPKYQYGIGCLSDGVLGCWIARMAGLGEILDREKVQSTLHSIHKYNFKPDLSDHANPQRPSFACGTDGGLLLCTWPKGGQLSIPFVYSNEVWTGIEYQVASHLMLEGMVDKGLDIVRACRDRYDGSIRNPFNEYECGHWYARALASYGLMQGLTGVRYDAIDKTLSIDSQIGDTFRSFLSTATGFGTVGLQNGRPFLKVAYGTIPVEKVTVSGKAMTLR